MQIAQTSEIPTREKQAVALSSVFAALILTVSKGWIGWWTGSLGILSEAAHSALDLLAAGLTYVSVRFSDRPADSTHHFGHGKVENLSAFLQTGLLLITCIWIIFEAVRRLFFPRSGNPSEPVGLRHHVHLDYDRHVSLPGAVPCGAQV